MEGGIALVALLVRNYDEAVEFFTRSLNFALVEDSLQEGGKRWVVVAPPGGQGAGLLLARADTAQQQSAVGNQSGGRVFLFLHTDDFERAHARMLQLGVVFTEAPRQEAYGTVAVFLDLYGNKWDLIQPSH